jgi:hypothetical protein
MSANRRLSPNIQWAIAVAAMVLGAVATLLVANALNHAGWSPWTVSVSWIAGIALATMLVKLRHSSGAGIPQPGGHGAPGGGDGMQAGGG